MEKGASENRARISTYPFPAARPDLADKELEKALLSKVDGVILASGRLSDKTLELFEKARAEGIKIILTDSTDQDALSDAFISLDNQASGREMAEELAGLGFASVLALSSGQDSASLSTALRSMAMAERFEESGIDYSVETLDPAVFTASRRMEELVLACPDGTCLVPLNSRLTLMTAETVEQLGRGDALFVAGWCEEPEAFRYVSSGVIDLLATQDVYTLGRESVRILTSLLEGGETERENYMPAVMVDRDNLAEYWDGEKRL